MEARIKGKIFFIILCTLSLSLSGEIRIYEERTREKVITHTFTFFPRTSGYVIELESKVNNNRIIQKYETDSSLATCLWEYKNKVKKTKISARRVKNTIFLSGLHKGKKIEKKFKINEWAWNQVFHIGLEKFVLSSRTAMKFWSIGTMGPGDMKITKFSVKKKGKTTLLLNGKSIGALRVKMSLSGLLSIFWSGQYCYRISDGKFLQYRGKSGPGTPVTVMQMISEKQ